MTKKEKLVVILAILVASFIIGRYIFPNPKQNIIKAYLSEPDLTKRIENCNAIFPEGLVSTINLGLMKAIRVCDKAYGITSIGVDGILTCNIDSGFKKGNYEFKNWHWFGYNYLEN